MKETLKKIAITLAVGSAGLYIDNKINGEKSVIGFVKRLKKTVTMVKHKLDKKGNIVLEENEYSIT